MLRNSSNNNRNKKRLSATANATTAEQHARAIHQSDRYQGKKCRCGMGWCLRNLSTGCFLVFGRLLSTTHWTRTNSENREEEDASSISNDDVFDVPLESIPPRVNEDIRTMGDETCMFHNKIQRILNLLPRNGNNNVGYIVIDTFCPAPFFMIRWSGAALIMAKPLQRPVDLDEFAPFNKTTLSDDSDEISDRQGGHSDGKGSDSSARNINIHAAEQRVLRNVAHQYKIDPFPKDPSLHRFFFRYNMSAAPEGLYSLEIVGIRCNLRSDLRSLDYDPANNTAKNQDQEANIGGGDPRLMSSLPCVANPVCGLSLNQEHIISYNGGTRNVHPEAVVTSKEDELWVVESIVKLLENGGPQRKKNNETDDDNDDTDDIEDLPTKIDTRYQEPLCFYEASNLRHNRPSSCGASGSRGLSWTRYHYRPRLSHRQVLEKLEKATSQGQPLKVCMIGDSHSRYIADANYFLNFFHYVFVRFSAEFTTAHAQHAWKHGAPGPEIRVVLNDESVLVSSTNSYGADRFCLSERTVRFPRPELEERVVHCTSNPPRVSATWYRAHFTVPHNRRIKSVIVRDYVAEEKGSGGQNKTSAWFGGGYDSHGNVLPPSATLASVHLSMEPDDLTGVHAVWSSSIGAADIVPDETKDEKSRIKRLLDYHLNISETVTPLPWFNLSLVSITHSGHQRPSEIVPRTATHRSYRSYPFPHECEYSGIIMGQWMASDPYTLDRLHDEMVEAVRYIRSVTENADTALRSVWWRSHNINPLRATSLACPVRSWHDPSMAWAYNVILERAVRQEGGPVVRWMDHDSAINPAWDRAMDWNHPIVVFFFEALELFNAVADQALQDRNLM